MKDKMTLDAEQLKQKVNNAEQILVVYGQQANFSAVAVATTMYLWLRAQGKKVSLVSPALPVVEYSHLVGINKVKNQLSGENLVITLPFPAQTIERVVSDLNQQSDELSLIIKPKRGQESTHINQIPVTYQATDYDLFFLIDVRSASELNSLGSVAANYWSRSERNLTWSDYANPCPLPADAVVSLSKDLTYATFWSSFCKQAELELDADQASNLLMALEHDSDHFTAEKTNAETFELAAWLMRHGGQRFVEDKKAVQDFRPENHLPKIPKLIDFKQTQTPVPTTL